tara:strand:+ start:257 stop:550 length:294 start_codon:yes stop_codon:yes gene_type:complete
LIECPEEVVSHLNPITHNPLLLPEEHLLGGLYKETQEVEEIPKEDMDKQSRSSNKESKIGQQEKISGEMNSERVIKQELQEEEIVETLGKTKELGKK